MSIDWPVESSDDEVGGRTVLGRCDLDGGLWVVNGAAC